MSTPNDEQREQTQTFIGDSWQSFVADRGGKVTDALLAEWRDRMGPFLDMLTADE